MSNRDSERCRRAPSYRDLERTRYERPAYEQVRRVRGCVCSDCREVPALPNQDRCKKCDDKFGEKLRAEIREANEALRQAGVWVRDDLEDE